MRIAWRRVSRLGHLEVFALIGALSFFVARFFPVLALPFVCPFKAVTGYPCASCGMTHAFVALARGGVAEAFSASPLGALLAAGAWLFAAADIARAAADAPIPVIEGGRLPARALIALLPLALLGNWAYLVARAIR